LRELDRQTILITGASDGLERALAAELAAGGATVLIHARDEGRGKEAIDAIGAQTANDNLQAVQWLCGDDMDARNVVIGLIEDAGFVPVDLGGTADGAVMEAPRREGAVYGEEYRAPDAAAVIEAVRAGIPIPPTPKYE
jgi:NAD(P)-dependent dehydrogenase (short-subunit alcohol dehydrogenase family)